MNANSVYPLIHESMLPLIARWLKHKREFGSSVEKALYKDMKLLELIQRLLEKRAVYFYRSEDRYKLIDNKKGEGGWESVGTDDEIEPLVSLHCYVIKRQSNSNCYTFESGFGDMFILR